MRGRRTRKLSSLQRHSAMAIQCLTRVLPILDTLNFSVLLTYDTGLERCVVAGRLVGAKFELRAWPYHVSLESDRLSPGEDSFISC